MDQPVLYTLFAFVYGAAAIQSLLLAGVLWWRPAKQILSNRILALLNFLFTILLLSNCHHYLGLHEEIPIFLWWPSLFWLLIPPVYYLYARTRLSHQARLLRWDLFHLIPFLVVLFLWKDIIFISNAEKLNLLSDSSSLVHQGSYRHIISFLFPSLGLLYLSPSIFLISRFQKKNKGKLTRSAQQQIVFLQIIYCFLLGFIILAELMYLFPGMAQNWPPWLGPVVGLVIPTIVYIMSYMALYDPEGLFEKIKLNPPIFHSRQLPVEQSVQFAQLLEQLMNKEELYLNTNLNQEELARKLGIQPRQLSRLLKQQFSSSFSEYINTYRIQKVKDLMMNEQYRHWNLVAIAYEAGFNSKSTFNRIFKKHTGLTPKEFSQKHQTHTSNNSNNSH